MAAAANPKRRALKRETLRRWLDASPKPNDARRARRARVNRLRLVAWLAWRREAPAREARARAAAAESRSRAAAARRLGDAQALREGVRAWIAATRYATHLRTAHARVLAKTRERRLKATIAAWRAWRRVAAGFRRASETFVARGDGRRGTRHRQDVVHASVLAQTREYPRERREATVLDVQIRANSSGVVRRRAVAAPCRGGDAVADAYLAVVDDVSARGERSPTRNRAPRTET